MKVWHAQRSENTNDLDVYFVLKTRAGRWARTRMIDDTQLLWDILKNADDDIVAFEVTLRDMAGRAFVRRIYDKGPGEYPDSSARPTARPALLRCAAGPDPV